MTLESMLQAVLLHTLLGLFAGWVVMTMIGRWRRWRIRRRVRTGQTLFFVPYRADEDVPHPPTSSH